jgi:hypothetical protein
MIMKTARPFATTLPRELTKALDQVCRSLGLRKNHVVESALREKLEDLLDAHDLDGAIREATGFHSWRSVKRELKRG